MSNIPFILASIGSQESTVRLVAQIAQRGSKVAVMLRVIIKDAADDVSPEYSMDVGKVASWADGVQAVGVRTHFYPGK